MQTRTLARGATQEDIDRLLGSVVDPAWILVYAVADFPLGELLKRARRQRPDVPIFGTTTFQGSFAPSGFERGATLLIGEAREEIVARAEHAGADARTAKTEAAAACQRLQRALGRKPDVVLMHATPGFEERVLEGIAEVLGRDVTVYGGSAADDNIGGAWKVFNGDSVHGSGFVLAGFTSPRKIYGEIVGGYLPTDRSGRITRAEGRVVYELDGRPAAQVYNEWTGGIIANELKRGGVVLDKTTMSPVGRVVDESMGVPQRLLSHPHEVVGTTGALSFFTELKQGDVLTLMNGSPGPLIGRVGFAVERAVRNPAERTALKGGILVFCGGCLSAFVDRAPEISAELKRAAGADLPFAGVATFGEQGCIVGKRRSSMHGNLMSSVLLFA